MPIPGSDELFSKMAVVTIPPPPPSPVTYDEHAYGYKSHQHLMLSPFCFCQSGKSVLEEVCALPRELTSKCNLEADSIDDGWESVYKSLAPSPH